jgi:hypothetical protein
LCWAFFAGTPEQVEEDPTLLVEMQESLKELCNKLEERFPDWEIPKGRNTELQSVRLTLDPIQCEHRPLLFYIVRTPFALLEIYCNRWSIYFKALHQSSFVFIATPILSWRGIRQNLF